MGTWGPGPFDNDAAGDFLVMFDEADATSRADMVRGLLEMVATSTGVVDYDGAAAAVAAAAIVAYARSGSREDAPGSLADTHLALPDDLAPLAVAALDRIASGDSEWRELWAGSEKLEQATRELAAIRAVLIADSP